MVISTQDCFNFHSCSCNYLSVIKNLINCISVVKNSWGTFYSFFDANSEFNLFLWCLVFSTDILKQMNKILDTLF